MLLISLSIHGVTATKLKHNEGEARKMYERWLLENEKNYNNLGEKERRFIVFKDNLKLIETHNLVSNRTYELGLNQFADLTVDESCCWAFSAAGAVEGINQITTGELISLSEQQLIDCATETNDRCDGGDAAYAFMFIKENGGIVTNKDYPFTGDKNATCKAIEMITTRKVTIDSYEGVPIFDEMSLKKAVANQPIAVGIDARNMHFYKDVILIDIVTKNLDFS
ncbi:unnamed protein product [Arabidopsis arenosa]|uniref:Cysteine protease n=1 Tax=Arabidopsis arenosa TaxID=38785 RepID=A0A8S2AKC7_ARAAE|nr:unnamed protein product [Arabidopsis arenosa]